jgi:hypothetical protein
VAQHLLVAEKRDYTWFFGFSGSVSVCTDGPWRLVEERVVITSDDDGHKFGLPAPVDAASALSMIVGRSVDAVAIDAASGDLTISFSGRTRLQLLQMSRGYEAWRLSAPEGEMICTGGGTIAHFPSS